MATALLIIHSLVAVALLGAITHKTLATWVPSRLRSGSFFGRFVPCRPLHLPTLLSFCTPSSRC